MGVRRESERLPRHNHRGGNISYVTEDRYTKAIVACLRRARRHSLDVLSAKDDAARVKLSRLHDDMEAEVFGITGAHFHEGAM